MFTNQVINLLNIEKTLENNLKSINYSDVADFLNNYQKHLDDIESIYPIFDNLNELKFDKQFLKTLENNANNILTNYNFNSLFVSTEELYEQFILILNKYKNYEKKNYSTEIIKEITNAYNNLLIGSVYYLTSELKKIPFYDEKNNLYFSINEILKIKNSNDLNELKSKVFLKITSSETFLEDNLNEIFLKFKTFDEAYNEISNHIKDKFFLKNHLNFEDFLKNSKNIFFSGFSKHFFKLKNFFSSFNYLSDLNEEDLKILKETFLKITPEDFFNFLILDNSKENLKEFFNYFFLFEMDYLFLKRLDEIQKINNVNIEELSEINKEFNDNFEKSVFKILKLNPEWNFFAINPSKKRKVDNLSNIINSYIVKKKLLINETIFKDLTNKLINNFLNNIFFLNEQLLWDENFISKKIQLEIENDVDDLLAIFDNFKYDINAIYKIDLFCKKIKKFLPKNNLFFDKLDLENPLFIEKYQNFLFFIKELEKKYYDAESFFNLKDLSLGEIQPTIPQPKSSIKKTVKKNNSEQIFINLKNITKKEYFDNRFAKKNIFELINNEWEKLVFENKDELKNYVNKNFLIFKDLEIFINGSKNKLFIKFINENKILEKVNEHINKLNSFSPDTNSLFKNNIDQYIFEYKELIEKLKDFYVDIFYQYKYFILTFYEKEFVKLFENFYPNSSNSIYGKIFSDFSASDCFWEEIKTEIEKKDIDKYNFNLNEIVLNFGNLVSYSFDEYSRDFEKKFNINATKYVKFIENLVSNNFNKFEKINLNYSYDNNLLFSFDEIKNKYKLLKTFFYNAINKNDMSLFFDYDLVYWINFFTEKQPISFFSEIQKNEMLENYKKTINVIKNFEKEDFLSIYKQFFNNLEIDDFKKFIVQDEKFLNDYYFFIFKNRDKQNYFCSRNNLIYYLNYLSINKNEKKYDEIEELKNCFFQLNKEITTKFQNLNFFNNFFNQKTKFLGYEDFYFLKSKISFNFNKNILKYDKKNIFEKIKTPTSTLKFVNSLLNKYFINDFNFYQKEILKTHINYVKKFYDFKNENYYAGYSYKKNNVDPQIINHLNEPFIDETEILHYLDSLEKNESIKNFYIEIEKYNFDQEIYNKFVDQQILLNNLSTNFLEKKYENHKKNFGLFYFKNNGESVKYFFPIKEKIKKLRNIDMGNVISFFIKNFNYFQKEQEEISKAVNQQKQNSIIKLAKKIIQYEIKNPISSLFKNINLSFHQLNKIHKSYKQIKTNYKTLRSYFAPYGIKCFIINDINDQSTLKKGLFLFPFFKNTLLLSDTVDFQLENNKISFTTNDKNYQVDMFFDNYNLKFDESVGNNHFDDILKDLIQTPESKVLRVEILNLKTNEKKEYLIKNLQNVLKNNFQEEEIINDSFGVIEKLDNKDYVINYSLVDYVNKDKNVFILNNFIFDKKINKIKKTDYNNFDNGIIFIYNWSNILDSFNFYNGKIWKAIDYFNEKFDFFKTNKSYLFLVVLFVIAINTPIFLYFARIIWKNANKRLNYHKNNK